ncbi:MAG TPA: hypothetical protein VK635_17265 [Bradyrhizobium sp.]|jgi:hypothetical protein|nr:hypothetical protein [Bradyrhizobium sp.]
MTIKTSARPVLILATGLFVCFAGPSPVAAGADDKAVADSKSAGTESGRGAEEFVAVKKYAKHGSRHWKRHANRNSGKVALKSSPARKADATEVAAADGGVSTTISPSVANANAQLASADTPDGNARAMSARASDILQAAADKPVDAQQPAVEAPVVPPDALNDIDRTLPASDPPAPTMATAAADAPAVESRDESSSSDRTSLIGKIFMACGGLLTLASAARMFMG